MNQESTLKFDEKILYRAHQHWIVPIFSTIRYSFLFGLPVSLFTYFFSDYSWGWAIGVLFMMVLMSFSYAYYLWSHSWFFVGNQKVTISVRNGIFSQYAMNIRYRNIRDCAVSKHSFWSFLFKYGTIFIRSSANEGDFHADFLPKVGKIYALVNALTRYSDTERASIDSIESLHNHHKGKEFSTEVLQTIHNTKL